MMVKNKKPGEIIQHGDLTFVKQEKRALFHMCDIGCVLNPPCASFAAQTCCLQI